MAKLIVEVPDRLHQQLKRRAALTERTLKQLVTGLVEDYLRDAEEVPAHSSGTGLCGAWKDDRSVDVIINDIRQHRHWFQRNESSVE